MGLEGIWWGGGSTSESGWSRWRQRVYHESFSADLLKLMRRNYVFRHNVGTASLQSRSINATLQRIAGLTRNMLLLVKNMIFAHKICCCWLITWSLLRV